MEKDPKAKHAHGDVENPYQPLIDSSEQGTQCFYILIIRSLVFVLLHSNVIDLR